MMEKILVDINGGNIKQKKLVHELIDFASKELMPRLYGKLFIYVYIDKKLFDREGLTGAASYMNDYIRPRDFNIEIDANLDEEEFTLTILHEMVHVKQLAKEEMKDRAGGITYWRKTKYITNKIEYKDRPWEMEADLMEKILYEKWLERI